MLRIRLRKRRAERVLFNLQSLLNDFRSFWKETFQNYLINQLGRIFATGGYGTWPETSRPNPILIDTERLFQSYTTPGTANNVNQQYPKVFVFGSDVPYARYHEQEDEPYRLAQRQVVNLLSQNAEFIMNTQELVDDWVQGVINREDSRSGI